MTLSKTGLALCALYVIPSAAFLAYGLSIDGDPKGRFVLLQLPLVPALAVAEGLGLGHLLEGLSFAAAYLTLVPATLLVLYEAGWIIGRLRALIARDPRRGPSGGERFTVG